MSPRIEKAIDIFLDALNNGTLRKGTCGGCAVANLIANGLGIKISSTNVIGNPKIRLWGNLFCTFNSVQSLNSLQPSFLEEIKETIDSTDFTVEELMKIEFAFETNTIILYTNYNYFSKNAIFQDQLKGLEAVVKVMLEFDESKNDVKEIFTKKAIHNFQLQTI